MHPGHQRRGAALPHHTACTRGGGGGREGAEDRGGWGPNQWWGGGRAGRHASQGCMQVEPCTTHGSARIHGEHRAHCTPPCVTHGRPSCSRVPWTLPLPSSLPAPAGTPLLPLPSHQPVCSATVGSPGWAAPRHTRPPAAGPGAAAQRHTTSPAPAQLLQELVAPGPPQPPPLALCPGLAWQQRVSHTIAGPPAHPAALLLPRVPPAG